MTAGSSRDAASELDGAIHLPAAIDAARRQAPYSAEVRAATSDGRVPNVYVFAGPLCWDRAIRRRLQFGPGTALVLPEDVNPEELKWPSLDSVVVAWPCHDESARARKLRLAQALIRDGLRYVAIEHAPLWIQAWREGSCPCD